MFCSQCGTQLPDGSKFCPHCGISLQNNQQNPSAPQPVVVNVVNNTATTNNNSLHSELNPPKSRWIAFFLCLFAGYLGAHKFYVGKGGMGILYLLTFGLFGIGWTLDTIILLLGGSRDKWGRKRL